MKKRIDNIKEYDQHGNLVYYRNSDGFEEWFDRDDHGNKIHYRNSYGYKEWYEHDANGNIIHYKNSYGVEYWYDSNGRSIFKEKYEQIHGVST